MLFTSEVTYTVKFLWETFHRHFYQHWLLLQHEQRFLELCISYAGAKHVDADHLSFGGTDILDLQTVSLCNRLLGFATHCQIRLILHEDRETKLLLEQIWAEQSPAWHELLQIKRWPCHRFWFGRNHLSLMENVWVLEKYSNHIFCFREAWHRILPRSRKPYLPNDHSTHFDVIRTNNGCGSDF